MQKLNCRLGNGVIYRDGYYYITGARYYEPEIGELYSLSTRYGVWYSVAKPNSFYFYKGRLLSTREIRLKNPYCFETTAGENVLPAALYLYLYDKRQLTDFIQEYGQNEHQMAEQMLFIINQSVYGGFDEESACQDMEIWITNTLTSQGYDGVIFYDYLNPIDIFVFAGEPFSEEINNL